MKLSKKQALIAHHILMLKQFSLERLMALSTGRGKETRIRGVLQKLGAHGYVTRFGDDYALTSDLAMRLELLDVVRKVEKGE